MSVDPIFWLLAAIGFVVLEAMTLNLVSIWFAVGSAAATNGDRALGREAVVLTPVSAEAAGRVRLDGVDWNARCATPGDTLAPGQSCRVAEIHSTLLIVEPVLTETARRAAH